MSATSQIEVFQIILPAKTTFGDLVQKKFYGANTPKQSDENKIKKLLENFYGSLVKDNVWEYKDKKKGLTVFLEKGQKINDVIKCHKPDYVIEGYLDGGRYDMIRKMAQMSDKTKRNAKINSTDIVAARYYFYMYTPMDKGMGLLLLEKKSDDQIRDAVKCYLEGLFKGKNKCRVQQYFPKAKVKEFIEGSYVDTLYSIDYISSEAGIDEAAGMENQSYEITVQVKKIGGTVPFENVEELENETKNLEVSWFGKLLRFDSFKTRKGIMKNPDTKKQSTFDFVNGASVHPCIELDEEWVVDGIVDRAKVKGFCDSLKAEVYKELLNIKKL